MAYTDHKKGKYQSPKAKEYFDKKQISPSDILEMEQSEKIREILDCTKGFVEDVCVGNQFNPNLTTNQLRNIYDHILRINPKNGLIAMQMVRPKLAYIAARQNKPAAVDAINYIDSLIEHIENVKQFQNFKKFFEAVVAYHKYYSVVKQKK